MFIFLLFFLMNLDEIYISLKIKINNIINKKRIFFSLGPILVYRANQ